MANESKELLLARQRYNRSLPCVTPGCHRKRAGAHGERCSECTKYKRATGHYPPISYFDKPRQGSVRMLAKKRYRKEFKLADEYITRYKDLPAVRAALSWLRNWQTMAEASYERDHHDGAKYRLYCPARAAIRRLLNAGVTREEMLKHACAAYLFIQNHPDQYDARHAQQDIFNTVGGALVQCIPSYKAKDEHILRNRWATEAGKYMMNSSNGIVGFFNNLKHSIDYMKKLDKELQANSREPLAGFTSTQLRLMEQHKDAVLDLLTQLEKGDDRARN